MTVGNLDLHELRNKLKTVHESQGVSKSIAMKLMQELEEARAQGRKEWGRANKAEETLNKVSETLSKCSFEDRILGEVVFTTTIRSVLSKTN